MYSHEQDSELVDEWSSREADIQRRLEKYGAESANNLYKKLEKHMNRADEAWNKYQLSISLVEGIQEILGVDAPTQTPAESSAPSESRGTSNLPSRRPQVFGAISVTEFDEIIGGCRKHELKKILFQLVRRHRLNRVDLTHIVKKYSRRGNSGAPTEADGSADNGNQLRHTEENTSSPALGGEITKLPPPGSPGDAATTAPETPVLDAHPTITNRLSDDLAPKAVLSPWGRNTKFTTSQISTKHYLDRLVRLSELQEKFVRFCDADHSLTLDGARQFLSTIQHQDRNDGRIGHCLSLIASSMKGKSAKISIRKVLRFLSDPMVNPVFRPDHGRVYQDMTQPLSSYFISSSHNTFLDGPQLGGRSCTAAIRRALLSGVRMIELDCYNGQSSSEGQRLQPVVRHGNSKSEASIPLEEALDEIRQFAFTKSQYPLILTLENHCSPDYQRAQVALLDLYLGDMLAVVPNSRQDSKPAQFPANEESDRPTAGTRDQRRGFASPAALRKRILLRLKVPYNRLHEHTVDGNAEMGGKVSPRSARSDKKKPVKAETEDIIVIPELEALCYLRNFRVSSFDVEQRDTLCELFIRATHPCACAFKMKRKDMSTLAVRWHRHPSSCGSAVSTSWNEVGVCSQLMCRC